MNFMVIKVRGITPIFHCDITPPTLFHLMSYIDFRVVVFYFAEFYVSLKKITGLKYFIEFHKNRSPHHMVLNCVSETLATYTSI